MAQMSLAEHLKKLESRLLVTSLIGLLILIFLSIFSNFLSRDQAAHQAASLIQRTVDRGDFRETIYTLNDAKLDFFNAVLYYGDDGKKLFSIPAQLDPEFAKQDRFIDNFLYAQVLVDLHFGGLDGHKVGTVQFIFGRYSHVPYTISIWVLFLVITFPFLRSARRRVIANFRDQLHLQEESSRADLARRVRHDIRSPLSTLQIATKDLAGIPERQRLIIQRSTDRIREIVGELELVRITQPSGEADESPAVVQAALPLIQDIIMEKRTTLAFRSQIKLELHADDGAFAYFVRVRASELKRSLSNIIENAIEASDDSSVVAVAVLQDNHQICIEVRDQGAGIDEADLRHIGKKGFSRKPDGSGLGLYYSKKMLEDAGGELEIKSLKGKGTVVSMRFPLATQPAWHLSEIRVPRDSLIIVIDDQEAVRLSWKVRIDEILLDHPSLTAEYFASVEAFEKWNQHRAAADDRPRIYFLDYDLGSGNATGIDLARNLQLRNKAILVTGHFDAQEIQSECLRLGVSLLPKSQISEARIYVG